MARFCQVNLKTIHNWADKGEIEHFRTPGRHLRFRRLDVIKFLRKFGYPVPPVVGQIDTPSAHGKPVVIFIEPDQTRVPQLIEKLKDLFEIRTFDDQAAALLAVGESTPEVLVFDPDELPSGFVAKTKINGVELVQFVKCVLYAKGPNVWGGSAYVKKGDLDELRNTLSRVLKDEINV